MIWGGFLASLFFCLYLLHVMSTLGFSHLKQKYSHFITPDCQIDCDHGWSRLLEDLCAAINLLMSSDPIYVNFRISSIKQKFGVLMIEYNSSDELIQEIIDFTHTLSYNTCEICGQEGKLHASLRWSKWSSYKTLCNTHAVRFRYYEINLMKGKGVK